MGEKLFKIYPQIMINKIYYLLVINYSLGLVVSKIFFQPVSFRNISEPQ